MPHSFDVLIEQDEDGYYVGTVVQLPGCHTQAKNIDELMTRMKEAIHVYLEATGSDSIEDLHFIGIQRIEVGS